MTEKGSGRPGGAGDGEALEDVLASIRALVRAETDARLHAGDEPPVLMLTPDMRVEDDAPAREGELLADGLADLPMAPAPILDEEAIREVVNRIVREELQGELGDRISRNLRKLIRREMNQIGHHREGGAP
jgi:hypothetical protein